MTFTGEWRDSLPLWASRDTVSGASSSPFGDDRDRVAAYYIEAQTQSTSSGAWTSTTHAAWNGSGAVEFNLYGDNSAISVDNSAGATVAVWWLAWVTLIRTGTFTATEGILPPGIKEDGVFLDPNVVGVEWEPTSVAFDQRLTVTLGNANPPTSPDPVVPAGEPVYVKLGTYGGGVYTPGFLPASTVAAHETLATITPATANAQTTTTITTLPGNPNDDLTVAIALIDHLTQTQTPPPFPTPPAAAGGRMTPLGRAQLECAYKPRFRLIYATEPLAGGRIPPIRHVQRGDGLGLSTAPRTLQVASIQGSLRNSSYL